MQKIEDLVAATKLGALLKKEEEKKKCKACWIVVGILAAVAIAGIALAVYKCLSRKCDDDFDDVFEICDDDFDDDFFEETEE
ncbi:MAG: DUF4366 domain-containing protein [Lachnospiraceae bacterium]|nr:DUF4366 domain-containing protein [Lachnospiraceae bacterium]